MSTSPCIYIIHIPPEQSSSRGSGQGNDKDQHGGITQKNDQCKCHVMWRPHTTGSCPQHEGWVSIVVHPFCASQHDQQGLKDPPTASQRHLGECMRHCYRWSARRYCGSLGSYVQRNASTRHPEALRHRPYTQL
jgi:hypothetical protein